jgi:hypothetical protein
MRRFSILAARALAAISISAPTAWAGQLQSADSCQVGMRVTTSDGHTGTITRVDRSWSYCYVRQDDTGRQVGYLYSLLQSGGGGAAGGSTVGGDSTSTLPAGVYECFADGHYTFMDMRITGPGTYAAAGGPGNYRIEGNGQIVFTSGSLQPYHGKLLIGGRIGLNTNGDSFYATSCELNRNRK